MFGTYYYFLYHKRHLLCSASSQAQIRFKILSISYLNHIIVPSMFLFIPLCDSMWSFRVKANMHKLLYCWFIYVFPLEIQLSKEEVKISLTGLFPPHVCVSPKTGPRFPTSYAVIYCVFSELKWEEI